MKSIKTNHVHVLFERCIDNFKTLVRPNMGLRATESAGLTESERGRESKSGQEKTKGIKGEKERA